LRVAAATGSVIVLSVLTNREGSTMAEITIRISDRALKVSGVVLSLLFLLWGFSHFWESGVFRAKYQIRLFVPEAKGLYVGAPVRLDGMQVGTVSTVELAPNFTDSNRRIEVALRIEKRFQNMLRQDSSAALMTESFLGGRLVNIQRGFTGPPINAGEEIRVVPVVEVTFADFLDVLGKKAGCKNEGNSPPDAKSPTTGTKSPTTH
jgi:ABC-type transporter Mla subunit MlaD